MSPTGKRQPATDRKARALDSAARKLETKEARQNAHAGQKTTQPVRSVGRSIRQGRIENA